MFTGEVQITIYKNTWFPANDLFMQFIPLFLLYLLYQMMIQSIISNIGTSIRQQN